MKVRCSMCGKMYKESLRNVIHATWYNFLHKYFGIGYQGLLSPQCEECWEIVLRNISIV